MKHLTAMTLIIHYTSYVHVSVILACIDEAKSYSNQVFCLSVNKISGTTNNIGTSIEQPKDMKLYKDQTKRQAFSKTFRF